MVSLQELSRIAEIEFTDIVDTTEFIGINLRKCEYLDPVRNEKANIQGYP